MISILQALPVSKEVQDTYLCTCTLRPFALPLRKCRPPRLSQHPGHLRLSGPDSKRVIKSRYLTKLCHFAPSSLPFRGEGQKSSKLLKAEVAFY